MSKICTGSCENKPITFRWLRVFEIGAMQQLITKLSNFAFARRLVRMLHIHQLANWHLRHFPLMKRLPTGVIYRVTHLESIPLAVEMFEKASLYDAALLPANFITFVDLGCNVGYFTCWLANLAHGRKLKGLMLDANPNVVAEARWHANANQMPDVFAMHGIVGEEPQKGSAEFFLYDSNICSTSQRPDSGLTGQWKKIDVPCVSVEEHWHRHFGESRCHILKLDIEGSELNFLKTEQSFLKLVDSILVEWHKWRVDLAQIETFLGAHGFVLKKILEENKSMGTAFFATQTDGHKD
jgi:FkbM family methyltransferase